MSSHSNQLDLATPASPVESYPPEDQKLFHAAVCEQLEELEMVQWWEDLGLGQVLPEVAGIDLLPFVVSFWLLVRGLLRSLWDRA